MGWMLRTRPEAGFAWTGSERRIFNSPLGLPGQHERRYIVLSLVCLTCVYAVLALYLNSFHSFWSPDSGGRFAMIRSWMEHGHLVSPYYPAASIDPAGQINPLSWFLFRGPHNFYAMYPPLFPLLSGLAYRAFGFSGLTLLPVLSGLGTVLVTYMAARRLALRFRCMLPLVMGLATPLVLYSVVFWDHSAQMLLTAVAGYWVLVAVQNNSSRFAIAAGAALGVGVWLHELFLALFLAAWLSSLPLTKSHRHIVGGLLAGFMPIVLLWGLCNWAIYGVFGGAHLAANVLQNNNDHPFYLQRVLSKSLLGDRALLQLTGATLFSVQNSYSLYILLFVCFLIVYIVITWFGGPLRRIALFLGLILAALALFLMLKTHSGAGLFEATPLLIPALAIPWYNRRTSPEGQQVPANTFYAWCSRTCWLFICFMLINPMVPGVDWGSRYLLPVLPLLMLMALHALEKQSRDAEVSWRGVAPVTIAILVVISFICQSYGFLSIRRGLLLNHLLSTGVRAINSTVVVTDNIALGPVLAATPMTQAQFLVRNNHDWALCLTALHGLGANEFTFIGTEFGLDDFTDMVQSNGQEVIIMRRRPLAPMDSVAGRQENWQSAHFVLKAPGKRVQQAHS